MTECTSLPDFVDRHRRLSILTGAGCSTSSGIPDYRDADGKWKRMQPTSGAVYPAARFAAQARTFRIGTLEINLEPSDNANQFGERRYGRASEMVPVWVSEVLASLDVAIIIPTG
jgi:NAD-dependent SIR2 family protein deacetylase